MSKKKSLYVCYCRLKSSPLYDERAVFCYAFSFRHAMNLAIRFCVDCWHWELNSFSCSEPVILTNFTH